MSLAPRPMSLISITHRSWLSEKAGRTLKTKEIMYLLVQKQEDLRHGLETDFFFFFSLHGNPDICRIRFGQKGELRPQ